MHGAAFATAIHYKNTPVAPLRRNTRFSVRLYLRDVLSLKALGPLTNFEFHKLPFIQRFVSVHLDRGEMDENVLPGLPLNEPIPF